jgi:hypothetical protein
MCYQLDWVVAVGTLERWKVNKRSFWLYLVWRVNFNILLFPSTFLALLLMVFVMSIYVFYSSRHSQCRRLSVAVIVVVYIIYCNRENDTYWIYIIILEYSMMIMVRTSPFRDKTPCSMDLTWVVGSLFIQFFSFPFLFNPVKDTSSTVSVSLSDSVISEFRFLLVLYVTFVLLLLLFNVHSHSKSILRNSIYLAVQIEKYVHRWTEKDYSLLRRQPFDLIISLSSY